MGEFKVGSIHNNWEILDNTRLRRKYFLSKCVHCGYEKEVAESQLNETRYKDSKCNNCTKIKVGTKFTTFKGYEVEVLEYNTATNILIRFSPDDLCPDGYIKRVNKYNLITDGKILYPYHRGFSGVGYLGCEKGELPTDKHIMYVWSKMIQRCYNPSKKDKIYSVCTVYDQWHSYKNFYEWYVDQQNKGFYREGYQIEKDLLCLGNKIYSPENCVLVPEQINSFLNNFEDTRNTGLPSGVTWKDKNNKYQIQLKDENKQKQYLGLTSDPVEGYEIYKDAKEAVAKKLAEIYKKVIRGDAYSALINFKCPDWDWKNKCYLYKGD